MGTWLASGLSAVITAAGEEPLQLHPDNARYFLFRGKPAVLIGAGEHYGAVLNLDFDVVAYLEEISACGLNHTRLFTGTYRETPESFGITGNTLAPAPGRYACPWARSAAPGYFDGTDKFDLGKWDDAYFQRLVDFVRQAGRRGIVVEVTLFCTMYSDDLWRASPMNAANNIHGIGRVGPYEAYSLKERQLTEAQEAVTRKIVRELNDLDNVYFEVVNEPYERPGVDPAWEDRIIKAIVTEEASLPRKHLISSNLAHRTSRFPTPHPSVSIFNFHGGTPEDVALNYALGKAIGDNETGGVARDDATYRLQGWQFLLAGGALFSHLDFSFATSHPRGTLVDYKSPGGGSHTLRRQLAVLKDFVHGLDFLAMKPDTSFIQQTLPETVQALALAEPGKRYAVYLWGGKRAELRLKLPAGTYRAEWVSPLTGAIDRSEDMEPAGGIAVVSSPPYREDIALRLARH